MEKDLWAVVLKEGAGASCCRERRRKGGGGVLLSGGGVIQVSHSMSISVREVGVRRREVNGCNCARNQT